MESLLQWTEATHLFFNGLCSIFLSGLSQYEVVADHFALHSCYIPPRAADHVTSLSVVGCNRDH